MRILYDCVLCARKAKIGIHEYMLTDIYGMIRFKFNSRPSSISFEIHF